MEVAPVQQIGEDLMDKTILNEYIDACALIKETEQDIVRLQKRKKTIVIGNVKGSMNDFPYAATHFHVEGIPYTYSDDRQLRVEEKLLEERKNRAEEIKTQVEAWMNTVPIRMQRIIRYHFFEDLGWEQTADRIGRKATGESVKKEFYRFMKEN